MAQILPHLIFSLERFDRASQSVRVIGGVLIALEDPVYVGRLLVGSETVEDKSDLIVLGRMTHDLIESVTAISDQPGIEITRQHGELFTLFDDPQMTERNTKAAFVRHGTYTSFVRRTDRYERILREFIAEQHP